jgi:hypothetical protein
MADLYDTLSPSDQATVRSKLLAIVQTKPCPTVDTTALTSTDALNDPGNRALAVDCFQTTVKGFNGAAGVFDQATYSALVGWWPALPTWKKGAVVVGGVATAGLVFYGVKHHAKKRRRLRA